MVRNIRPIPTITGNFLPYFYSRHSGDQLKRKSMPFATSLLHFSITFSEDSPNTHTSTGSEILSQLLIIIIYCRHKQYPSPSRDYKLDPFFNKGSPSSSSSLSSLTIHFLLLHQFKARQRSESIPDISRRRTGSVSWSLASVKNASTLID